MISTKPLVTIFCAIAVVFLTPPDFSTAQTEEPTQEAAQEPARSETTVPWSRPAGEEEDAIRSTAIPLYEPPLRGAPRGRIGGGSRGIGDDLYTLFVMAPDHVGQTSRNQPGLFWYLSKTSDYPIELTVIENTATAPSVEIRLPPPIRGGVHLFDLKDYNVRLEKGVEYRWFVSIVPDPKHRSRDVLACGAIELDDLPEKSAERLSRSDEWERMFIYAESGFWYDAMSSVFALFRKKPDDPLTKQAGSSLLEQVGLPGPDITFKAVSPTNSW